MSNTDWLGQEYDEDDYVVYSTKGGSASGNIALARVVKIHESGAVTVEDVIGSRYPSQVYHSVLTDTRTGKAIQWPYSEHEAVPEHWTHPDYPGVRFTYQQRADKIYNRTAHRDEFTYVPRVWQPWVEPARHASKRVLNKNAGVQTIMWVPTLWAIERIRELES